MRKLLNTLYVMNKEIYLSLDGENIVLLNHGEEVTRIPLHNIEGIISFSYFGASPALMGACVQREISLSFLSRSGRFLARATGETRGNILLRREQYHIADKECEASRISRNFIFGKVYNSKWVLERATRDYALRVDVEKIKKVSHMMSNSLSNIRKCSNNQQLLGYEGEAASLYFSVFDELILQQKENFYFVQRNKRPPLDNVNAMLSFVYTLLANMVAAALETVGLDPYAGLLHTDRPGRKSLALDLMEELRSVFADRFVLTLINKKIVNASGFIKKEDGAVIMDDDTRKTIVKLWQEKKEEEIKHPFLEEKIQWGLVPYIQAMLLARYIRGDIDEYPPFLWK